MTPAQNTTAYIQGFEDGERFTKAKILQEMESDKREWVDLTDEEVSAITSKVIGFNSCVGWEEDYARAIMKTLKEKNT
jgi:hypothetical protein